MVKPIDIKKIAKTNRAVDLREVEQVRKMRKELEKAGLLRKSGYRLAPPFGGAARKPIQSRTGSRQAT